MFIHAESHDRKRDQAFIFTCLVVTEDRQALPMLKEDPLKTAPRGGNETVMVVADDEPDIRNFLRELLEKFGYTVVTFSKMAKKPWMPLPLTPDKFRPCGFGHDHAGK